MNDWEYHSVWDTLLEARIAAESITTDNPNYIAKVDLKGRAPYVVRQRKVRFE